MKYEGPFQVIKRTWDEFLKETSISGLANSGKSRNGFFRRLMWQLAFGIMFSASSYQIVKVIQDYLTYPITSTVTVNNDGRVWETLYLKLFSATFYIICAIVDQYFSFLYVLFLDFISCRNSM